MRGKLKLGTIPHSIDIVNGQEFYLVGYRNTNYADGQWRINVSSDLKRCKQAIKDHHTDARLQSEMRVWGYTFSQENPMVTQEGDYDWREI